MNAGIDVKDASVAVFQESSDELIESLALQENGKAEVLDEEY